MNLLELLRQLSQAMFRFFEMNQYLALFVFIFVEECGIPLPVPGDTLVAYSGYLATQGRSNPLLVISVATVATAGGSSILYWIAYHFGHRFVIKYGRFIHLSEKRVNQVGGWFKKYGALAIVLGRLIPGMRVPTTVMSGVFEVPYRVFVPATFVAAAIWAGIYFTLGYVLGREYLLLGRFLVSNYRLALAIVAIIVVSVALYLLARRANSALRRSSRKHDD
jgi:membrane protein DedA with SNARE-associated domain